MGRFYIQQIKNLQYKIKQDLEFVMASEQKNIDEIAKATTISRTTIYEILHLNNIALSVYEKFYSYIYNIGYRINSVKEDLLKMLDLNESSRLSLNVKEGIEKIEEQYGPSKYGKIKFSKESLF